MGLRVINSWKTIDWSTPLSPWKGATLAKLVTKQHCWLRYELFQVTTHCTRLVSIVSLVSWCCVFIIMVLSCSCQQHCSCSSGETNWAKCNTLQTFTLQSTWNCIAHCALHIAHCTLHIAQCTSHTASNALNSQPKPDAVDILMLHCCTGAFVHCTLMHWWLMHICTFLHYIALLWEEAIFQSRLFTWKKLFLEE